MWIAQAHNSVRKSWVLYARFRDNSESLGAPTLPANIRAEYCTLPHANKGHATTQARARLAFESIAAQLGAPLARLTGAGESTVAEDLSTFVAGLGCVDTVALE